MAEIALSAIDCDSLQKAQQDEIAGLKNLNRQADSIIFIQEKVNQVNDEIQTTQKNLLENQEAKTESVEHELRRWKVGGILAGIVIVLQALALIL